MQNSYCHKCGAREKDIPLCERCGARMVRSQYSYAWMCNCYLIDDNKLCCGGCGELSDDCHEDPKGHGDSGTMFCKKCRGER